VDEDDEDEEESEDIEVRDEVAEGCGRTDEREWLDMLCARG